MKEKQIFLYSLMSGLLGISITEAFFNPAFSGLGFITGFSSVLIISKVYITLIAPAKVTKQPSSIEQRDELMVSELKKIETKKTLEKQLSGL